jgi:hypothetical protein
MRVGVPLGRYTGRAPERPGRLNWVAQKMEKGEVKEEAGRAGLSFQLGFGPLPNRN